MNNPYKIITESYSNPYSKPLEEKRIQEEEKRRKGREFLQRENKAIAWLKALPGGEETTRRAIEKACERKKMLKEAGDSSIIKNIPWNENSSLRRFLKEG